MAIAFDAFATTTGLGTPSGNWTHTPVGTPRAIVVTFIENSVPTSHVTALTYGGVAMTKVAEADNTTGEVGNSAVWFLGSSIPTGAQTVTATVSASGGVILATSYSFTAAGNTQLAGIGSATVVNTSLADPSATVTGIAGASFGVGSLFSGINTLAVTAGTSQTLRDSFDFGSQTAYSETNTSQQASGDQVIAFNTSGTADDVAMVVMAFEEIATTAVKTYLGLATASVKTTLGLAIASRKTWDGLA